MSRSGLVIRSIIVFLIAKFIIMVYQSSIPLFQYEETALLHSTLEIIGAGIATIVYNLIELIHALTYDDTQEDENDQDYELEEYEDDEIYHE